MFESLAKKTIVLVGLGVVAAIWWISSLHSRPDVPQRFANFLTDSDSYINYEDRENPPLTHVRSGFKCISVVGTPSFERFVDLFAPTNFECQWGWFYEVKNNLPTPVRVNVTYELQDRDEFVIAYSQKEIVVKPDQTETIRKVATEPISLDALMRTGYSGWKISHQEIK